ncbi:hypothetical protein LEP1GSC072_0488 [Leptospira noguchii str. Bonito]|nr:hypothetical protein LEP1GSC072_0488 [Leptospira noguchii str. Bonito]
MLPIFDEKKRILKKVFKKWDEKNFNQRSPFQLRVFLKP